MLKTVVLHNIFFVETDSFYFRIYIWIESSKEHNLFENRIIFCNIINIFTATFDQIIAVLPNFFTAYSKLG